MGEAVGQVTELLIDWSSGNEDSRDRLMQLVYDELRRLAASQLRGERSGHTLQATALVNEAYLRLVDQEILHSAASVPPGIPQSGPGFFQKTPILNSGGAGSFTGPTPEAEIQVTADFVLRPPASGAQSVHQEQPASG